MNLLEYHNGSLARALVDLEKNGRLHSGKGAAYGAIYVGRGGHLPGHHVQQVVVGIAGAETVGRLDVAQAMDDVVAGE